MAKKTKTTPAECDWTWEQIKRDRWTTDKIPDGESCTPKITESSLDSKGERRFYCYRDNKYLGSHTTLEAAKDRCWIGEMSRESEVFIAFQEQHPGKVPPGLHFTEADWHEWKRHNPTGPGSAHQAEKVERNTMKLVLKAEKVKENAADLNVEAVIKRLKDTNPKTANTGPWKRWELMFRHNGKTIRDFLANGGNPTTLKNAIKSGYVEAKSQ